MGDSLSDLDMAGYVQRMFVVANGAAVPSIHDAAAALSNVTLCEGSSVSVGRKPRDGPRPTRAVGSRTRDKFISRVGASD